MQKSIRYLKSNSVLLAALMLSVLFAVALVYMMSEIQDIVDELLRIISPGYQGTTIETGILRPFGYIAFVITLFLIVLGFLIKRDWLAVTGSVALYLPTFGYFAFVMWSLFAGIGVLRVLWFPLLDLSPDILKLGDIAYCPLFILIILILGITGETPSTLMNFYL